MRLGAALEGMDGLEAANANLMGVVTLQWDDERVAREEIVSRMNASGFRFKRNSETAGAPFVASVGRRERGSGGRG